MIRKSTKKHKKLSIKEKNLIIDLIESGKSKTHAASQFGVTSAAITYIKKKKDLIREAMGKKHLRKTCRLGQGQHPLMEKVLLEWINQKQILGIAISGPIIKEKALEFNRELERRTINEESSGTGTGEEVEKEEGSNEEQGSSNPAKFRASDGWLSNFKVRHGIRYLSFKGEKSSAGQQTAVEFSDNIKQFVEDNQYNLDNIYNADETGFYTKSLPKRTFVLHQEKEAAGFKESKKRVTLMNCANATGTHKLPLLLIGKSQRPRCLKNVTKLPLIYKNQKHAWMNGNVHFFKV